VLSVSPRACRVQGSSQGILGKLISWQYEERPPRSLSQCEWWAVHGHQKQVPLRPRPPTFSICPPRPSRQRAPWPAAIPVHRCSLFRSCSTAPQSGHRNAVLSVLDGCVCCAHDCRAVRSAAYCLTAEAPVRAQDISRHSAVRVQPAATRQLLRSPKVLFEPFPRAPAFVLDRGHWLPLRISPVQSRSSLACPPFAPPR
jgi:hypothetical protein